jgi:hypothetical protein
MAPKSPTKGKKAQSAVDKVPFGNFDDPPVLVPKKDPLQKKREQRDKLIGLRDELLSETMGVMRDAMRFRDIDEHLPKEADPNYQRLEEDLGPIDAERAYRIAKAAWRPNSEAPAGLKLAAAIAVGILKANASEKGAAPALNIGKVIINAAAVPQFEEREVSE